tara:strand:- start:6720 stop:6848 length:129 start_codon:yes stop_codon:yes gene_type:complete
MLNYEWIVDILQEYGGDKGLGMEHYDAAAIAIAQRIEEGELE